MVALCYAVTGGYIRICEQTDISVTAVLHSSMVWSCMQMTKVAVVEMFCSQPTVGSKLPI